MSWIREGELNLLEKIASNVLKVRLLSSGAILGLNFEFRIFIAPYNMKLSLSSSIVIHIIN